MAEAAITVASIAMGVYIAAVSVLLGSDYAKNLKTTTDKEYPAKKVKKTIDKPHALCYNHHVDRRKQVAYALTKHVFACRGRCQKDI